MKMQSSEQEQYISLAQIYTFNLQTEIEKFLQTYLRKKKLYKENACRIELKDEIPVLYPDFRFAKAFKILDYFRFSLGTI